MSRKRDKPYHSRHHGPYPLSKRRRPPPLSDDAVEYELPDYSSSKSPATVVVIGLPQDCALLDIKSRFQIYGCISRTTMQHGGAAYVTFRSKESAEAAITASVDPSFGISIDSKRESISFSSISKVRQAAKDLDRDHQSARSPRRRSEASGDSRWRSEFRGWAAAQVQVKVQVVWPNDPVPQWREAVSSKDSPR
ncbi:uncharacterized protein At1g27050-like isoform X2 [Actinidia eriantha]|uniref:uncharacterized protein At1g27050-like isoform X2 n=1 Tax=Actinidia eriantha TaxID=165200 RepID=UPI002582632D|nr:uncharacterized protein At1g27050-like isoform X2 [Actinidia eriantha]